MKKLGTASALLLILVFCFAFAARPVEAAPAAAGFALPTDPQPLARTPARVDEVQTVLNWYEEKTEVTSTYYLVNPAKKIVRLTLSFPARSLVVLPVDGSAGSRSKQPSGETSFLFKVLINGEEAKIRYNSKQQSLTWSVLFQPEQSAVMNLEYAMNCVHTAEGLLATGFRWPARNMWAKDAARNRVTLKMKEINPGLIKEVQPEEFSITADSLSWSWEQSPEGKELLVAADIETEKESWEKHLGEVEKTQLEHYLQERDYLVAAGLFAACREKAPRESKVPLWTGQAYYLEKAGKRDEALSIWKELADNEGASPFIYWHLGKEYASQVGKLAGLYNQVRELQVHPLLQRWLANQLPPSRVKSSPPEVAALAATVEEGKDGLLVKGAVSDRDGDVRKIALRCRWEEGPVEEKPFEIIPFCYNHKISCFIPADKPMQRLYYQFIAIDSAGQETASDWKETFYLNRLVPSDTYTLPGAKLVLGDYSQEEYDKVFKWFKSYLKMAKEAGFVPLEGQSPYFIFLGKPHQFTGDYQGPLFLLYTPAPFSPDETKIHVHRYFLSFWYGSGWNNLPRGQLEDLGDGLLLGRGPYVLTLKYLNDNNPRQFAALLAAVGQGKEWTQALAETYHMSAAEIRLKSLWFAYGYNLLAVLIILFLAWLGKTGYLVRFIRSMRAR
ncbi:MAG: hypothetical protein QHH10_04840 [Peptococcaceae bacterium]|jgi:hypothetical protein|nr:hypothetical protein [Peptococcaceae bacterium]MDH7524625.1 hypothetical protein [Peptococcaceae bacterium]